ncbi:sigma 54-interacting transcriptional regulator [Clostridium sp. 'White wine YQ']|uniref:sigma 54-interacting transcriptional regulator n=1 Tax=Clostridium sp. 'White wine YQ' TaxID=3027474 RepID=UPI002366F7D8|nr:sigma 54-interacting transcriptional regulator [Clostridium sp. 'White wine YQ']MDD7795959.1 sigma 54-interacting transcriptional regulator [Clostridium sp. 'White wine YQ']
MYTRNIAILDPNGLHTRVAAMLVNEVDKLQSKYSVNLYIKKPQKTDWLAFSMLALLSLRVRCNETIIIGSKNDDEASKKAIDILYSFIMSKINLESQLMEQIDVFIEESKIANEQILDSLPIGIVVIDINSNITYINDYALKIFGIEHSSAIGKPIEDSVENTKLPSVIASPQKQFGQIQHINGRIITVNRSPIISKSKLIGACGVFQDVSDIVGMKELNEKFLKIMEISHDLICFVDENGIITYINPAYINHLGSISENIGKSIFEVSPKGLRVKAFEKKERIENIVRTKNGVDIISTITPLFIDGDFKGILSTSKVVSEIKELASKLERSQEQVEYYREELKKHTLSSNGFSQIIGISSSLKEVIYVSKKAAESTSTVLVRGESGTGKELIANAIHHNSTRKDKPFIKVNCAAIPENLLESELFGYEKGAFTGATKSKPGKFSIADGGTIFLDEIGDMPLSMQVKLLRVLQEREIESLGGITPQKIDVRVITATNRNLEEMIQSGTFREDLYYRLNVLSVQLPPLRDRKEDIPALVEYFILKINDKLSKNIKGIDKTALSELINYSWPGNIRELENIIERAINLCEDEFISSKDLPYHFRVTSSKKASILPLDDEILPFEEYEKIIIQKAMEKYGSYNKAGKALGLTHRTISLKCKKYGIE